ncbi:dual specificity protein kinase kns1 [Phlyctochytrium planicorne]|nr:dual specificity protein kinase kns1 [Phlyctochytrium planicorne]
MSSTTFDFSAPAPPQLPLLDTQGYGFANQDNTGLPYSRSCYAPPPPSPLTIRASGHALDNFFPPPSPIAQSPYATTHSYKSVLNQSQQSYQNGYSNFGGNQQQMASPLSITAINALAAAPKYPSPPHPLPHLNTSLDGPQNFASLYPSGPISASAAFPPPLYPTRPSTYDIASAPHSPQSQTGYSSVAPQTSGRTKRPRESDSFGEDGSAGGSAEAGSNNFFGRNGVSDALSPVLIAGTTPRAFAPLSAPIQSSHSDFPSSNSSSAYLHSHTYSNVHIPPPSPSTNTALYSPASAPNYLLPTPTNGSYESSPPQYHSQMRSMAPSLSQTASIHHQQQQPSMPMSRPVRQLSNRSMPSYSGTSTPTSTSHLNICTSAQPQQVISANSYGYSSQTPLTPIATTADIQKISTTLQASNDFFEQSHYSGVSSSGSAAITDPYSSAARPVLPYPSSEKYHSVIPTTTALAPSAQYPNSAYISSPVSLPSTYIPPSHSQSNSAPKPAIPEPSWSKNTMTGRNGKPIEVIDLTDTPPPTSEPAATAVLPPPPKKRRRVDGESQRSQYNITSSAVTAAAQTLQIAKSSDGKVYWQQQHAPSYMNSALLKQEPHVQGVPPVVRSLNAPCDDAEGHFIVNINDDLSPRYKILRLLGQGTFGKVVEAYDRANQKRVAIKIIRAVQKYRDASKIEIRVLTHLKEHDPRNEKRCIHLTSYFDYRNHVCMVFELLSQSVFDFLKENSFNPFPMWQIKSFAKQILGAVAFLHEQGLIHTDLKPENLMLENNKCRVVQGSKRHPNKTRRELLSTDIRLIDFGSAIFHNEYHSSVVSTRHYRAPEIILGLGWSFPCDMWSIGCILVEFYTGDALFQTHDNLEHLAMMESVLGKFPNSIIESCFQGGPKSGAKYFKYGNLDWPETNTSKNSRRYVKGMQSLKDTMRPCDTASHYFVDLVSKLLTYDPKKRLTAAQALKHPFFKCEVLGPEQD